MTEEENQSKLEGLFGKDARSNVILATTRWDFQMRYDEKLRRQQALKDDWEKVCCLNDTEESAWELLETLLSRYAAGQVPQLQEQGKWRERRTRSGLGTLTRWFSHLLERNT
jgi:hypothetical protein